MCKFFFLSFVLSEGVEIWYVMMMFGEGFVVNYFGDEKIII